MFIISLTDRIGPWLQQMNVNRKLENAEGIFLRELTFVLEF